MHILVSCASLVIKEGGDPNLDAVRTLDKKFPEGEGINPLNPYKAIFLPIFDSY